MNQQTDDLTYIVDLLLSGSVVLCPSDTIWGLSCNAFNEDAVNKIFEIKQRDKHKKLILLMNDLNQLNKYVDGMHPRIEDLLIHYDYPLTIIHKASSEVPAYLISEDGTIAVRLVRHLLLQELIKKLNLPIVSTSANVQGAPSPINFDEVATVIKEQVDYIFNSERASLENSRPSSIIKYTSEGELIFLRE